MEPCAGSVKKQLEPMKSSDGMDPNLSRRSWLVTIGQAAGYLTLSSSLAESEQVPQLPAGVYLPSTNHLGHALMSAGRFHTIPAGCPTDYIRPRTEAFVPQFFSAPEYAVVRRITQLLLGGNEDPSLTEEVTEWVDLRVASAAGVRESALGLDPLHRALTVAYLGSAQVNQLETLGCEKICREGLEWLASTAQSRRSDQFLSLDKEQQIAILKSISDERSDQHSENAGTRFFAFLKPEIVRGFYTSQAGLKELDFKGNAFYARSPGCDSK